MFKSIFKAVVVSSVTAVFSIGCGGNDKSDDDDVDGGSGVGGGDVSIGTTLSIKGTQVYDITNMEDVSEFIGNLSKFKSNYTGLFTHSSSDNYGEFSIIDVFKDPVVSINNGKLTINLGEPNAKNLISIKDVFRGDSCDISNPNAKSLDIFGGFGGNCDDKECFVGLDFADICILRDINRYGDLDFMLVYVDTPVTISEAYGDGCRYSLNLRKGWNAVAYAEIIDACWVVKNVADSDLIWIIYQSGLSKSKATSGRSKRATSPFFKDFRR